jgi:hypothetical protein
LQGLAFINQEYLALIGIEFGSNQEFDRFNKEECNALSADKYQIALAVPAPHMRTANAFREVAEEDFNRVAFGVCLSYEYGSPQGPID